MLVSACAPGAGEVELGDEAIINGRAETGYREVVAIYHDVGSMGGGLCSGTVIGPYAILTAKHCVFDETASGYVMAAASSFYVLIGTDVNAPAGIESYHRVNEIRTTSGSDIDGDVSGGRDIAILLLSAPIRDVTPRGYATGRPADGETCTIVGFGRTSTSSEMAGIKYSGTTRVSGADRTRIQTNGASWTCQGDSGGPLFDAAGNVTGITSYGFTRACTDSTSVFTRVSAYTTMIADALTYVPPCTPRGEVCNDVDDDCDGSFDEDLACTQLGGACTANSECAGGRCEDTAAGRVCVENCFPDDAIPSCPVAFHCEVTGCGDGRCVPGDPGAGAAGDPCTADTQCASGYCAPLVGGARCGRQCIGGGCGAGEVCDLVPVGGVAECGACVPEALATGPRGFGSPCSADTECVSGDCALDGAPAFCTQACATSDECPGDFHCAMGVCVRGALSGQDGPCATAADCRESAGACVEGACVASCDPAAAEACPLDHTCTATSAGNRCLRNGTPLGELCASNGECRSRICGGTCTVLCDTYDCPEGYECMPSGAYLACFPPAAETGGGCSVGLGHRAPGLRGLAVLCGLALALGAWRARRRR